MALVTITLVDVGGGQVGMKMESTPEMPETEDTASLAQRLAVRVAAQLMDAVQGAGGRVDKREAPTDGGN